MFFGCHFSYNDEHLTFFWETAAYVFLIGLYIVDGSMRYIQESICHNFYYFSDDL